MEAGFNKVMQRKISSRRILKPTVRDFYNSVKIEKLVRGASDRETV